MMRDTKIVQEFLSKPAIKAGCKPKFHEFSDLRGYAADKQRLLERCASAEEYERLCKQAAERRGI
jgi:hypothetical protein